MSPRAVLLLSALCLALFLASLALPFGDIRGVAARDSELATIILVELRLPRTLLALLIGAMLGSAGAGLQALLGNPLASPDLVGTSSGAALGAIVTGYLIGLASPFAMMLGAMIGALAALILLLALAGSHASTATLLLAGVALSLLTGALSALALAIAPSPFAFYDAYDWLMGSLVDRSLPQLLFAAPVMVASILLLWSKTAALDALALGEESASAMGYPLVSIRRLIILAAGLGVGAAVSVAGAIGFIGLVAPYLARGLTRGLPGRALLPAALIGAVLLLAADILVRIVPAGRALPIGIVTALAGAPFFLSLVMRGRAEAAR